MGLSYKYKKKINNLTINNKITHFENTVDTIHGYNNNYIKFKALQ